jgi:hypothetical protein
MHQQIINQLFVGDTVMHPMQVCCITSGGLAHRDTGKFPGGSQSGFIKQGPEDIYYLPKEKIA